MNKSSRLNLYQQLINDIQVTDNLLDVGCGFLFDLIFFEYSEFKRLEGLDKNLDQPFRSYLKIKKLKFTPELHREFRNRFHLKKIDFREYEFKTNGYSLIICNNVLHFYPDNEKHIYLDTFYNSLQGNGLLFVSLNHNKNENNTDPAHMTQIGKNVFRNNIDPEDIRYLVEPLELLNEIRKKYSLLEHHTSIDEKIVSFVIRKKG